MKYLLDNINSSMLIFTEAKSLPQLCKIILEEIMRNTKIYSGAIFLLEDGRLEQVYSSGVEDMVKISRSDHIYRVLSEGKLLIIDEDISDKFNFLKKSGLKNVLCLPLIYNFKPVGLIALVKNKKIILKQMDYSLLQLYANAASMYIKKTQLTSEVQSALEIRDQFISLASHELRTPLTSINGYIQLLYRRMAQEDTPESRWVKELYEESGRLTRLIKELLDVNRIKQGQLEFVLNEVDVAEVVESAIKRFGFANSDNEIRFFNQLEDKSERIIGDHNKLLQMVSAILNNAAKFSDPGSKIDIILCVNHRYILLKIKDTGKGIPKKEIQKIFRGFYKIGKDEKQGMGVGLLLAEHIVRHHRGKIEIASKENHGTTIEIQLPRINF